MENGRGKALPQSKAGRSINHENLSNGSITYCSDASVMIRHVEYPNFYSPLHRFHHFYDINTSDSLANRSYFGPLLGLSALASTKQSGPGRLFNETDVLARQVALLRRKFTLTQARIGWYSTQRDFSQSQHTTQLHNQWRLQLKCRREILKTRTSFRYFRAFSEHFLIWINRFVPRSTTTFITEKTNLDPF